MYIGTGDANAMADAHRGQIFSKYGGLDAIEKLNTTWQRGTESR